MNEDDLKEQLNDHKKFLERSSNDFDQGHFEEAKRIAVSVRVLVHDTKNSHSLLKQLGVKNTNKYLSTCPDFNVTMPKGATLLYSGGLALPGVPNGYIPRCMSSEPNDFASWVSFEEWWNQIVIWETKFTRIEIILALANKDGGAHVDPKINAVYESLKKEGSGLRKLNFDPVKGFSDAGPIVKIEQVCARQIAYELLASIKI
jgi:hypothetical protein